MQDLIILPSANSNTMKCSVGLIVKKQLHIDRPISWSWWFEIRKQATTSVLECVRVRRVGEEFYVLIPM